ncbi:nucleotidyltransferase domain-containing protein [Mucilaginibacter sp. AK015]|uniref:nucleotidyltransferase domain-containing protein n=1 Tax=Mucilaginibacter sp. AK015 TaxID=2723072 RepID=UPI00160C13BB|nr:putative nucleotidyltransferase [Mucilaginibacter sp. AK015]
MGGHFKSESGGQFERNLQPMSIFAFGSATRSNTNPNDIDLLIVYDEEWQPNVIRRLLSNIDYLPIHLIFMLREEQIETNFIELQKCVMLEFLQ